MYILTDYHMRSDNMSVENRLLIAALKMQNMQSPREFVVLQKGGAHTQEVIVETFWNGNMFSMHTTQEQTHYETSVCSFNFGDLYE